MCLLTTMIYRTDQSHFLGKIRQDTTDISFALDSYAARLIRKYAFKRNLEKVKKGSYYRNTVMDSLSLSLLHVMLAIWSVQPKTVPTHTSPNYTLLLFWDMANLPGAGKHRKLCLNATESSTDYYRRRFSALKNHKMPTKFAIKHNLAEIPELRATYGPERKYSFYLRSRRWEFETTFQFEHISGTANGDNQAYALTQLHDPSTILLCWRINSAGAEHIYDLARPVPENCSNV